MAASLKGDALERSAEVGILGAGTMGAGIAQVAAMAGHRVRLFDTRAGAAHTAVQNILQNIQKLAAKGRITPEQATAAPALLAAAESVEQLSPCGLIVEAIIEDLAAKQLLLRKVETLVAAEALLATNTSSLSITAIAAGLRAPERLAGMHFFNPAPVMALVEIVSGLATSPKVLDSLQATAIAWGKIPVLARSGPGFIVNRVARPFYGEALRLLSEGAADCATIDAVMRECGGFRMGPFELMDFIGHDVNYAVTESVFASFFGDPRFTPSLLQRELVDAGYLGRKSGRGFYRYGDDAVTKSPLTYEPCAPPGSIRIFGDDPLARVLASRLLTRVNVVNNPSPHGDGRIAETPACTVYRTDGRTATQRALNLGAPNVVLVDLALNYEDAKRVAIACADQAHPSAMTTAAGLLQAAGFAVSPVDDVPGLIVMRTVAMLANGAADAVHQGVCTVDDCDLAMRLGVNYPRGPLAWADELGAAQIVTVLEKMAALYGEPRYRISPLLRRKAIMGAVFHGGSQ